METSKTLDQAIELLTQLRIEMKKQGIDLDDKASDINLLLCKAHDQCALPPVVVSEAELPSNKELADIQEKYEDDVESDTSFLYGMIALRKYLSERGN
jgi:hypothetical protein